MKILQVISTLAPELGGPSRAVLGISAALSRWGHEVVIFTTDFDIRGKLKVPLETPVDIGGVNVVYFPVQLLKNYKVSFPLARALKKRIPDFDIVHIHSLFQFTSLAASCYCQKYRKPYLIRPLGQMDPYLLKRHALSKKLYFWLFERKNLERAQAVHFTSEEERLLSRALALKTKDIVVSMGIDLEEFRELPPYGSFRAKYPLLKDKKIILFLSRINFKKGLDILVKAFARIAQQRADAVLVIAGPDNEGYGSKVKKWLKKEAVFERTVFTGMLDGKDKLAAFRDSDVFVLPSYSENFGFAVVEAMACGIPVVISNGVAIHKDITRAEAGIVVDTDPGQLARALDTLLDDPEKRRRLGGNGQLLVRERFGLDRVVHELVKAYEGVLQKA